MTAWQTILKSLSCVVHVPVLYVKSPSSMCHVVVVIFLKNINWNPSQRFANIWQTTRYQIIVHCALQRLSSWRALLPLLQWLLQLPLCWCYYTVEWISRRYAKSTVTTASNFNWKKYTLCHIICTVSVARARETTFIHLHSQKSPLLFTNPVVPPLTLFVSLKSMNYFSPLPSVALWKIDFKSHCMQIENCAHLQIYCVSAHLVNARAKCKSIPEGRTSSK